MLTLFDLPRLMCPAVGLVCGALAGQRLEGGSGALLGALAGGALGLVAGRLLFAISLRPVLRELRERTTPELAAFLRDESCLTPNFVLLELAARSAVRRADLLVVLAMLTSEGRRALGWAALTSAVPELAARLSGYDPTAPRMTCEETVKPLLEELRRAELRGDRRGPAEL